MALKVALSFVLILILGLNLCNTTQLVQHSTNDVMPVHTEESVTISYQSKERVSNEIWYSAVDGEQLGSSDEKLVGDKDLAMLNQEDIDREEKDKMANDVEVKAMWATILEDKPAPQLVTKPVFYIRDTCPERRYRLWYYWEKPYTRICKVIRPWYQPVSYVRCLTKSCCCSNSIFSFNRCLPDGWTYHRFLVVCYNTTQPRDTKWHIVKRWFPQCCDCHRFSWTWGLTTA